MAGAGFRQGLARDSSSGLMRLLNGWLNGLGRPWLSRPGPVAQRGLHQRQRGDACGIRPQDPGPKRSRSVLGWRSSRARSSSANPPSGPIRMSIPSAAADPCCSACERDGGLRRLVAENQQALRLALAEIAIERHRLGDRGEAEDAALLGGLDDIGAHPLAVDPRDLGVARQNRLQLRGAHFDRLLHHVVEPGMFQRRKHIGDVGQAVLRPRLASGSSRLSGRLRPAIRGLPFAVAAVEHQDVFAGRKPQHVAEIIALVPLQRDRLARAQGGVDEQAGGCENRVQASVIIPSGRLLA